MGVTINKLYPSSKRLGRQSGTPSVLAWLIGINIGVFVVLRLLAAANIFTADRSVEMAALSMCEMPASFSELIHVPWTVVTYMFTQFDPFHAIFNVLWLYWFGKFYLDCCSQNRLLRLYIIGGLIGAAFFITSVSLFPGIPSNSRLIGSSASVLAIVSATALLMPDREVGLMFFGGVKLKWIALVMVAFDFINIGFDNAGGHIAHIGGALTGVISALAMKRQSARLLRQVHYDTLPDEQKLDGLLDKIRQSGFSSLTSQERATLFDISNRMK